MLWYGVTPGLPLVASTQANSPLSNEMYLVSQAEMNEKKSNIFSLFHHWTDRLFCHHKAYCLCSQKEGEPR